MMPASYHARGVAADAGNADEQTEYLALLLRGETVKHLCVLAYRKVGVDAGLFGILYLGVGLERYCHVVAYTACLDNHVGGREFGNGSCYVVVHYPEFRVNTTQT